MELFCDYSEKKQMVAAFQALRQQGRLDQGTEIMKKQYYFKNTEFKIRGLVRSLTGYKNRVIGDHFRVLLVNLKERAIQAKSKQEKEQLKVKLTDQLGCQEAELSKIFNKIAEKKNQIQNFRANETEKTKKIKELDGLLAILDKYARSTRPNSSQRSENSYDIRNLIEKVILHTYSLTSFPNLCPHILD